MTVQSEFNFDLDRIKKAVESKTLVMPSNITTADGFRNWLLEEADRIEVERLVELCEEKSYRMPEGLTREERHAWAKQTLLAHEYHQAAQVLLASRRNGPGVLAPSSKGLTEEQYHEVMMKYQKHIRLYSVIVNKMPVESFHESLYWDHVVIDTQIKYGTLPFEDRMAVYKMFLERDCKDLTYVERNAAANEMMKVLRLNV